MGKPLSANALKALVLDALEEAGTEGLLPAEIMSETGVEDLKAVKACVAGLVTTGEVVQDGKKFMLAEEEEAPAPVKKAAAKTAAPAKGGLQKAAAPAATPAKGGLKKAAPPAPAVVEKPKKMLYVVQVMGDDDEMAIVNYDKSEAKMTKEYEANQKKYGKTREVKLVEVEMHNDDYSEPDVNIEEAVEILPEDQREPAEPEVDDSELDEFDADGDEAAEEETEDEETEDEESPALTQEELNELIEEYEPLAEKNDAGKKLTKAEAARLTELTQILDDAGAFESDEETEETEDEEPAPAPAKVKDPNVGKAGTKANPAKPTIKMVAINELSVEDLTARIDESMVALDKLQEEGLELASEMLMRAIGKARKQLKTKD